MPNNHTIWYILVSAKLCTADRRDADIVIFRWRDLTEFIKGVISNLETWLMLTKYNVAGAYVWARLGTH